MHLERMHLKRMRGRVHSFLSRIHAYVTFALSKKHLRDDISRDDAGNRVGRISAEFQRSLIRTDCIIPLTTIPQTQLSFIDTDEISLLCATV